MFYNLKQWLKLYYICNLCLHTAIVFQNWKKIFSAIGVSMNTVASRTIENCRIVRLIYHIMLVSWSTTCGMFSWTRRLFKVNRLFMYYLAAFSYIRKSTCCRLYYFYNVWSKGEVWVSCVPPLVLLMCSQ